jgi:hypothetical protein
MSKASVLSASGYIRVSHALRRLREKIGDPLFVKVASGMQPSPRAVELAPVVQSILAAITMWAIPPIPGVSAGPGAPNRVSEADELREYARSPGKLTELAETDCVAGVVGLDSEMSLPHHFQARMLRFSRAAAQTRIVSMVRIRLPARELAAPGLRARSGCETSRNGIGKISPYLLITGAVVEPLDHVAE